jgi:N-acetylmuramoyl-L-alanine amidase
MSDPVTSIKISVDKGVKTNVKKSLALSLVITALFCRTMAMAAPALEKGNAASPPGSAAPALEGSAAPEKRTAPSDGDLSGEASAEELSAISETAKGILAELEKGQVTIVPLPRASVVVDAGHGGFDPGKVSPRGYEEKNINLAIASRLAKYLEQAGARVFMTRTDDKALASSKRGDLWRRADIANASGADLFVSIHQNSYPDSSVKGPQIFYYGKSEKSLLLGNCIQKQFVSFLKAWPRRAVKENMSYYVLKRTTVPAVLIECGFLSNPDEQYLLRNEKYQDKLAWAIYMGIADYMRDLRGKGTEEKKPEEKKTEEKAVRKKGTGEKKAAW